MRLLLLALMLSTTTLAQQPTEDEMGRAIVAAQQAVAKEFKVPEEHVQVVGKPQILPDHTSFHIKTQPDKTEVGGERPIFPAILITLDAGLGDKVCGLPRVLVVNGNVEILTKDFGHKGANVVAMTDQECHEVLVGVDSFMETVVNYQGGTERFGSILATIMGRVFFHDEPELKLSNEERRRFAGMFLEVWSIHLIHTLEDLEDSEKGFSSDLDESASFQKFEDEFARMHDEVSRPLLKLGALENDHIIAVFPRLKYARTLIDKHMGVDEKEGLLPPVYYHFEWDPLDFIFVFELGRLKLFTVFCRA